MFNNNENHYCYRVDSCSESCISRRRDTENDIKQLKWDLKTREDQCRQLEKEVQVSFIYSFFLKQF